ncbi:MAG: glycoside hydrolase family 15 protein, partial [Solirubrobacterales bacterium]
MKRLRGAAGLVALLAIGGALASGGSRTDTVQLRYLGDANALRTVARFGTERVVTVRSLGKPDAVRADPRWLARARPLAAATPGWAGRMYARSLLVLHAFTDERSGAAIAGAREGWAYVWPRDASTAAMALSSAGYREEARRIVRFLLGLDLGAAARFHPDGSPVDGRAAQGDAAGWVAAAARAAGIQATVPSQPWRNRADYQEGDPGDYLGNALASSATGEIRRDFERRGALVREADNPNSGLDTAAAWAVRPFPHAGLFPAARRASLRLAAQSGRFGIVPSESWDGGNDPWTAPTAWTAWSLAALGERRAALHLMSELRRAATPDGMLPERIDAGTGVPTSTTPLA